MSDTINELEAFFSEEQVDSPEEQTQTQEEEGVQEIADEPNEPETTDDGQEVDGEEDESDVDEDEPDEDDDGQAAFDEQEFTLTIDGKEVTVKGNELKSGYMRHAAFTKKTQEVAEERKALAQERTKVSDQANVVAFQAFGKLDKFNQAIQEVGGWEKLRATYPPEKVEQFTKLYVAAQQEANTAQAVIDDVTASNKEHNRKEISSILNNMAQTINGFTNESLNQMDEYLTKNGFTEDMALAMTHPQAWEMVYKAMKYDQAQSRSKKDAVATKQAKTEKRTHRSAPTKPLHGNTKSRQMDKAIAKLKSTGGKGRAGEQATIDALAQFLS